MRNVSSVFLWVCFRLVGLAQREGSAAPNCMQRASITRHLQPFPLVILGCYGP